MLWAPPYPSLPPPNINILSHAQLGPVGPGTVRCASAGALHVLQAAACRAVSQHICCCLHRPALHRTPPHTHTTTTSPTHPPALGDGELLLEQRHHLLLAPLQVPRALLLLRLSTSTSSAGCSSLTCASHMLLLLPAGWPGPVCVSSPHG